jgi:hypothetical protein
VILHIFVAGAAGKGPVDHPEALGEVSRIAPVAIPFIIVAIQSQIHGHLFSVLFTQEYPAITEAALQVFPGKVKMPLSIYPAL